MEKKYMLKQSKHNTVEKSQEQTIAASSPKTAIICLSILCILLLCGSFYIYHAMNIRIANLCSDLEQVRSSYAELNSQLTEAEKNLAIAEARQITSADTDYDGGTSDAFDFIDEKVQNTINSWGND